MFSLPLSLSKTVENGEREREREGVVALSAVVFVNGIQREREREETIEGAK